MLSASERWSRLFFKYKCWTTHQGRASLARAKAASSSQVLSSNALKTIFFDTKRSENCAKIYSVKAWAEVFFFRRQRTSQCASWPFDALNCFDLTQISTFRSAVYCLMLESSVFLSRQLSIISVAKFWAVHSRSSQQSGSSIHPVSRKVSALVILPSTGTLSSCWKLVSVQN